MIRYLCTCLIVGALLLASQTAHTAAVNIDLNGLKVGVDDKDGCIVHMSSPLLGTVLKADAKSAGLVDLAYPLDSFAPMRLASRFSKANVTREMDGLVITWDSISPSRTAFPLPEGKVSAQVMIKAAPDGRSVVLSCQIDNHSKAPVRQVLFPDIWGLIPVHGPDTQLRFARGVVKPFSEPIQSPDSAAWYIGRGWQDYPAALREAAALRKQFLPYFVDGVFLGNSVLNEPVDAMSMLISSAISS